MFVQNGHDKASGYCLIQRPLNATEYYSWKEALLRFVARRLFFFQTKSFERARENLPTMQDAKFIESLLRGLRGTAFSQYRVARGNENNGRLEFGKERFDRTFTSEPFSVVPGERTNEPTNEEKSNDEVAWMIKERRAPQARTAIKQSMKHIRSMNTAIAKTFKTHKGNI